MMYFLVLEERILARPLLIIFTPTLIERLIRIYKDDETLPRGHSISQSLLQAIEESRIAVIVFSKNYADSSWCLDELVYIMKCRDERGIIVMPIFYDVDPSQVRKQQGDFGEAFGKQEAKNISKKKFTRVKLPFTQNKENINKVKSWRKALVDASNIVGWEHKNIANGHESKVINEIVGKIQDRLFPLDADVDEELVGMKQRLQDFISQLEIGTGGVRMVGIWGIGGSGKTTLASSVCTQISRHFQGHCFLANIRKASSKHGLETLQQKIISTVLKTKVEVQSVEEGKRLMKSRLCNSKVLVVLDDVNDLDQLQALVGSHKWFGGGSRIIITTRDEHLLRTHRVDHITPIRLLSHEEAIRLFYMNAYNEKEPLPEYETLSLHAVSYAVGLPLALKVLGSFLFDKDKSEWISALAKLKEIPNIRIMDILRISYDGLETVQKELFLDIACFFRWKSIDDAIEIFDACGFHPVIEIKVLRQKALITTTDGKFDMHDLVQEMGHYIVRGEHPNNPEKHSRVWRNIEITNFFYGDLTLVKISLALLQLYFIWVLNDKIEATRYYGHSSRFVDFISNMKKLRWLSVVMYLGDNSDMNTEGPSFLSNELRYLYWERYPSCPFPDSFQLMKLVVLKLHYSLQEELWNGCKRLPQLKVLELCFMSNLLNTPDFDGLPCLEKLVLRHCDMLEEVHPSLGIHRSLEHQRLQHLKVLQLCYMENLLRTPDFNGLPYLQKLEIDNCEELKEIHPSIGNHTNIEYVSVRSCEKLSMFPMIVKMKNLKTLEIVKCYSILELPKIQSNMESLVKLSMNWIGKRALPSSVREHYTQLKTMFHQFIRKMNLSSLQKLDLSGCGLKDGEIPSDIGELSNLEELDLSRNDFSLLGFSLSQLTRLKVLVLSECIWLVELPKLPSSIAVLEADYCERLTSIGWNCHTSFKCLCEISLLRRWRGIVDDARRLVESIESILQGMGIENQCMIIHVAFVEIPKALPFVDIRNKHTMQLPENWCNDFCGFIMCFHTIYSTPSSYTIRMEKVMNDIMSLYHKYDVPFQTSIGGGRTWVGFVSFASLRHTSWLEDTPNTLLVSFDDELPCGGFGIALIPRKSGIAPTETSTDFLAFPRLNIVDYSSSKLTMEFSFRSNDKWAKCASNTTIKPKPFES